LKPLSIDILLCTAIAPGFTQGFVLIVLSLSEGPSEMLTERHRPT
jgi:hypothetical protein